MTTDDEKFFDKTVSIFGYYDIKVSHLIFWIILFIMSALFIWKKDVIMSYFNGTSV